MTPENEKKLIAEMASFIRGKGLGQISAIALECVLPFRRLLCASADVMEPLFSVAVARDRLSSFRGVISSEDRIRQLIRELESGR
jgi:hypothetical protein